MDERLAMHFAHLFIRDPLVVFKEDIQQFNPNAANHFENLQSTNWQHMRFKPPPPGSDIGWRVEFRPMEIQPSVQENAAFTVFIVLMTRAILSFDLNFYLPITRVTENMETAHQIDAVSNEKFYFRKDVLTPPLTRSSSPSPTPSESSAGQPVSVEDEYTLMSIDEIISR